MPTINDIKISDAEFTAMQELGTAFILKRAFEDNVDFGSAEDIVKDPKTKDGLQKIFRYNGQRLLKFQRSIAKGTPEEKWLTNFYLQQKTLLSEFSDSSFTVFNREGGFMEFITDLIRDNVEPGISKKDAWNPADIWLIKEKEVFRNKLKEAISGPSGTNTIAELNTLMRSMFINREVVGISLKLVTGAEAQYEEINVNDSFFKKLQMGEGDYTYKLNRVVFRLNIEKGEFVTQDLMLYLKNSKGAEVAEFQVKGNQTSDFSNLKFEGKEKGAAAARLGQAPLNLVKLLAKEADKNEAQPLYNGDTNNNRNYPKSLPEFKSSLAEYEDMFKEVAKNSFVKGEIGISNRTMNIPKSSTLDAGSKPMSEFEYNFSTVFNSNKSHIANVKLMQLYFLYRLMTISAKKRNIFLTDLLFIAQKKGNKVFDFGPFGKLY